MNCTLNSFLSPSLILLPPQLTRNLDLSAAIILLLICYMLHCVKDFSLMALLQANKKKPMKYFFSFIAIHTPLSRVQDITMRMTAGWQFRNKYHTNKNAFFIHTKICRNTLIWKMTQCGIYCLKAFPMALSPHPIHSIFTQDQATEYPCTFLKRFGIGVA